jgi:hypothetical protein
VVECLTNKCKALSLTSSIAHLHPLQYTILTQQQLVYPHYCITVTTTVSTTFPSSQTKILYILGQPPFPPLPATVTSSLLSVYDFDYSMHLTQVELYIVCPFVFD